VRETVNEIIAWNYRSSVGTGIFYPDASWRLIVPPQVDHGREEEERVGGQQQEQGGVEVVPRSYKVLAIISIQRPGFGLTPRGEVGPYPGVNIGPYVGMKLAPRVEGTMFAPPFFKQ
jgi:hypothetical protein